MSKYDINSDLWYEIIVNLDQAKRSRQIAYNAHAKFPEDKLLKKIYNDSEDLYEMICNSLGRAVEPLWTQESEIELIRNRLAHGDPDYVSLYGCSAEHAPYVNAYAKGTYNEPYLYN